MFYMNTHYSIFYRLLNLAIDTLRCVIELDPNFYDAHYNLAYLLHRNGQVCSLLKVLRHLYIILLY